MVVSNSSGRIIRFTELTCIDIQSMYLAPNTVTIITG